MIKAGSPEDVDRMMARPDADQRRPIDDTSRIQDFPKCGRPLVQVGSIYGLIEWLDVYGKYHLGWAHSTSIKRVTPDQWKGSSGL